MGSGKPRIGTRQATDYGAIFWERVHKSYHVLKTLTAAEERPGGSGLGAYPSETVRPWQLRKPVASSPSLKSSMRTTPSRGKVVER